MTDIHAITTTVDRKAVTRILAEVAHRGHVACSELDEYTDRIIAVLYPVTCEHPTIVNDADGYTRCTVCGDWTGVWTIR